VDLLSDNVYRFILKNIRNAVDAEDIVQNAFETLWIKRKEVSTDKVRSYLFTVAYNNMIDLIRKRKYSSLIDQNYDWALSEERNFNDVKDIIEVALRRLPEIQRSVILLRDYEGYSYKEIGDVTKLSESQVKVYIFRARKMLRKYLVRMENLI